MFFPFWVIFLLFGLASPVFFLTWYLTNSNVAGLSLITAIGYFLLFLALVCLCALQNIIKNANGFKNIGLFLKSSPGLFTL